MKTYSLSKIERIKLKKDFQKVYSKGQILYSPQNKIKVNYFYESSVNEGMVKAAFAVSKKAGNSVWRNRVKRLFREVYRNNKVLLTDLVTSKNITLFVIFSPNSFNQKLNRKINLGYIKNDFIDLLYKLNNILQNA